MVTALEGGTVVGLLFVVGVSGRVGAPVSAEGPAGVTAGETSVGVLAPPPHADKTKAAVTKTKVATPRICPMDYIVATRCPKFEPVLQGGTDGHCTYQPKSGGERVGFEPTLPGGSPAFRDRRFRSLSHLSALIQNIPALFWFFK